MSHERLTLHVLYVSASSKISYRIQVHLCGGCGLGCLCLHPEDCTGRSTEQRVDVAQRLQDGYVTAPQSSSASVPYRKGGAGLERGFSG